SGSRESKSPMVSAVPPLCRISRSLRQCLVQGCLLLVIIYLDRFCIAVAGLDCGSTRPSRKVTARLFAQDVDRRQIDDDDQKRNDESQSGMAVFQSAFHYTRGWHWW